jgi:quercetin dioxygenase-like cupin family protein
MKYRLLCLFLASALTLPSWAAEEKPTIVPVTKAPFHLLTFQDENMSLVNVTVPPGRSTAYHSHDQDLFFVIIRGAKIKNQVLGQDPVDLDFKTGNVYFANYAKTPGVHQIINVDQNTLWVLGLAIVHPEAGRFSPSARPAKYEVVMDNERVRAWRLTLSPGEAAPIAQQTAPGARFVVSGGNVTEKRPGKPDQPLVLKNGDFEALPAEEHGLENTGSSPVEVVEVELK